MAMGGGFRCRSSAKAGASKEPAGQRGRIQAQRDRTDGPMHSCGATPEPELQVFKSFPDSGVDAVWPVCGQPRFVGHTQSRCSRIEAPDARTSGLTSASWQAGIFADLLMAPGPQSRCDRDRVVGLHLSPGPLLHLTLSVLLVAVDLSQALNSLFLLSFPLFLSVQRLVTFPFFSALEPVV